MKFYLPPSPNTRSTAYYVVFCTAFGSLGIFRTKIVELGIASVSLFLGGSTARWIYTLLRILLSAIYNQWMLSLIDEKGPAGFHISLLYVAAVIQSNFFHFQGCKRPFFITNHFSCEQ